MIAVHGSIGKRRAPKYLNVFYNARSELQFFRI
jgi:hypothetical protein